MDDNTPETDAKKLSPTGRKILKGIGPRGAIEGHAAALARLKADGFASQLGSKWYITPRGRKAIAVFDTEGE